jgi:hypothetical protein
MDERVTQHSCAAEAASDASDGLSPKAYSVLKIVGEKVARPLSPVAFEDRIR